jgi:hypothetical protein
VALAEQYSEFIEEALWRLIETERQDIDFFQDKTASLKIHRKTVRSRRNARILAPQTLGNPKVRLAIWRAVCPCSAGKHGVNFKKWKRSG